MYVTKKPEKKKEKKNWYTSHMYTYVYRWQMLQPPQKRLFSLIWLQKTWRFPLCDHYIRYKGVFKTLKKHLRGYIQNLHFSSFIQSHIVVKKSLYWVYKGEKRVFFLMLPA